ncbi:MAG: hypothetical protein QGH60_15800 [Phycisphaerae bacterium]|nr:hypothetical protein [Phycisphaerae bacterium]
MNSRLGKRQLLTFAGVVLLGGGVCLFVIQRFGRQPQGPSQRLMSDSGEEPISLVVCSVNSARRSALRNASLASSIVNALPPRVDVILAVNDPRAFSVARNPRPDRVHFLELTSETSITIWPQDPFVVLRDEGGKCCLLVSRDFKRVKDREMAMQLGRFLGWPQRASTLSFEGGNIVSDDSWAFIGANTIRQNALELERPEAWVLKEFEAELGKRVLVIGPVPQPIGHIDMMLTPLGGKKILLADPAWGARLAEQELNQSPDSVEAFEKSCERMFLGAPGIVSLRYSTGKVVKPPEVVGETRSAIEHSKGIAGHLDRLAANLSARGYEVHRVPYLCVPLPEMPTTRPDTRPARAETRGATEPRDQASMGYPELTYNNVLLETVDGRRIVYLPQYGWDTLDRTSREIWGKLVDDVTLVNGFAVCAMYGGSLRCCTKVLARGARSAIPPRPDSSTP